MQQRRRTMGRVIVLLTVIFAAVLSLFSCGGNNAIYRGEGLLTVHYLDVGQSDCTFVEVGGVYTLMIDTGDDEHAQYVTKYVRELGYDSIDTLVLTHNHSDHIGGAVSIIQSFSPDIVYMTEYEGESREYSTLRECLSAYSVKTELARRNVSFSLGELSGEFLSPSSKRYEDENDNGAVLRLDYGQRSFLFMGDAGITLETDLAAGGMIGRVDVVKAGHHGSSGSSGVELVERTTPSCVIFSCSENNRFGHPSPYAVSRWSGVGADTFRTDRDGNIVVFTDGDEMLMAHLGTRGTVVELDTSDKRKNELEQSGTGYLYVLDRSRHIVHSVYCDYVEEISYSNKEYSSAALSRLYSEGYKKCEYCYIEGE